METKKKQHKMNVGQKPHKEINIDKSIINWELHQKVNNKKSKINKEINFEKFPNPKLHQRVSFLKSGIRILGYITLPFNLALAAVILVLSELIGILEELV
jgi:hypothetical protein